MFKKALILGLGVGLFYFWPLLSTETTARNPKDIDILPANPHASFTVSVRTDRDMLMPGQQVTIYFQSTQDCYLTLVDQGTSGKQTVIFPNPWSGPSNSIRANQVYTFPPPGAPFRFNVQGPDGVETVLAYATLQPTPIEAVLQWAKSIRQGRMKTIGKSFKDLVVEDAGSVPATAWSTAVAEFTIGSVASPRPSRPSAAPTAPPVVKESPYYVLAIGASTGDLKGCEQDARQFAQTTASRLKIPPNHIKLVTGRAATVQGFRDGLYWLRGKCDPDAIALVYFSGHGSYIEDNNGDEADGYDEVLIPYGFNPNEISTFMIDDEFNALIEKLDTSKVLVFIDACHSGTMSKDFGMTPKFYRGGLLGQPRHSAFVTKGMVKEEGGSETLLAASREEQTAIEKDGRGLFTVQFCTAVDAGAATVYNAFRKAREQVLLISGNQQEPVIFGSDRLARELRLR